MNGSDSFRRHSRTVAITAGILLLLAALAIAWLIPRRPRAIFPENSEIIGMSPDGTALVTRKEGTVSIWNAADGQQIGDLPGDFKNWSSWRFAFSPDGRWLAAYGEQLVKVWDVRSASEWAAIPVGGSTDYNPGTVFAPNSRWLAFRAQESDRSERVVVWDLDEQRERLAVPAVRAGILYFSPDGLTLAFETWEPKPMQPPAARLRVWEVLTATERPPLDSEPAPIRILAFSPDGGRLAAGQRHRFQWTGPHEVVLWDLVTGEQKGPWLVPSGVQQLRFTADGAFLLVGVAAAFAPSISSPGRNHAALAVIDPAVTPAGPVGLIREADILSPDARMFARLPGDSGGPVFIHDVIGQTERGSFLPNRGEEDWAPRIFAPNGDYFALVAVARPVEDAEGQLKSPELGELRVFETATGELQAAVPVIPSTPISFTPDSRAFVVLGPRNAPAIWDLPPQKPWDRIVSAWAALAALAIGSVIIWRLFSRRRAKPSNVVAGPQ